MRVTAAPSLTLRPKVLTLGLACNFKTSNVHISVSRQKYVWWQERSGQTLLQGALLLAEQVPTCIKSFTSKMTA